MEATVSIDEQNVGRLLQARKRGADGRELAVREIAGDVREIDAEARRRLFDRFMSLRVPSNRGGARVVWLICNIGAANHASRPEVIVLGDPARGPALFLP